MSIGGTIRRNLYWLNDFFHGSQVRQQYQDIEYILDDKEKGERRIRQYLNDLLSHVVTDTDFYKGYDGCSLSVYPVMNKALLLENKAAVMSKCFNKDYHVQITSGSTGIPFSVVQDIRKRNRVIAELKLFGKRCGYNSHERMAQFRVWQKYKKSRFESFMQNILCVEISTMTDKEMYEIKKMLIKKRISTILAYATTLNVFVKWLEYNIDTDDHFYVKTIITGAEALDDATRSSLEKIFGCSIVERYSNQENGVLGQQMPGDKKYYLNHGSYVFEILRLDNDHSADFGELGRIVVTDLFNYANPMIRYDTGDVGIMIPGNKASNGWPILSELYGRRIDMIYDTSKRPVSPHIIAINLRICNNIRQFQFIQTGLSEYILKINGSPAENILAMCLDMQRDFIGHDAVINVEYVDEIPVLASGKRKSVIQEAPQYKE